MFLEVIQKLRIQSVHLAVRVLIHFFLATIDQFLQAFLVTRILKIKRQKVGKNLIAKSCTGLHDSKIFLLIAATISIRGTYFKSDSLKQ